MNNILREIQAKTNSKKQAFKNRLTNANFNLDNEVSFAGVDKVTMSDAIAMMSEKEIQKAYKELQDRSSKKRKFMDRNRY